MTDTDKILSQLIEHFREIVSLEDQDIHCITSKLEIIFLKKKEYLLREGQVSRQMHFIAKGSLYAYHIDEKGKENTTQLGIENWWVNDLYSYLCELPSRMFIQANEDTTIKQISKSNLELLWALELLVICMLVSISFFFTGAGKYAISVQSKWD
ncbi:Crp/Fnr family transcriptional regulator [Chryseobacterium aureum]|uniref:Crp/Fnr family transcriptional regulator n=1 Tax=Chryseobacterium aureum TaxID=2497456 RepID=UPI000F87CE65|nr:cyclic nucleotide-binding domain-containing protein [Chryseobacterium aureum]